MPENEQWAAIALQNRLNNAKTIRERAAVRSDIERAKTDPAFKSRLAESASRGRFQSGGWGATQLGLAGASVLPMLPVIGSALGPIGTGLGTAAAAGLGAIGLANVKEGLERREEGLPGATGQILWGAADALPGVGWAGKLLRGLRGSRGARGANLDTLLKRGRVPGDEQSNVVRASGESQDLLNRLFAGGVAQPGVTATLQVPDLVRPLGAKGTLRAPDSKRAATKQFTSALQEELDDLLPTSLVKGRVTQADLNRIGPIVDPRVPLRHGQDFQPDVTWAGGALPKITQEVEGLAGLPESVRKIVRPRPRPGTPIGSDLHANLQKTVEELRRPSGWAPTGIRQNPRLRKTGAADVARRDTDPLWTATRTADASKHARRFGAAGGSGLPTFGSPLNPGTTRGLVQSVDEAAAELRAADRARAANRGARGETGQPGSGTMDDVSGVRTSPEAPYTTARTATSEEQLETQRAVANQWSAFQTAREGATDYMQPAMGWWARTLGKNAKEFAAAVKDPLKKRDLFGKVVAPGSTQKLFGRGRSGQLEPYKQPKDLEIRKQFDVSKQTAPQRRVGQNPEQRGRAPGERYSEVVTLGPPAATRKTLRAFLDDADAPEIAEALNDLRTNPKYPQLRALIQGETGVDVLSDSADFLRRLEQSGSLRGRAAEGFNRALLATTAVIQRNRLESGVRIAKSMGLMTDSGLERIIKDQISELNIRAINGFASTGRRLQSATPGDWVRGKTGVIRDKDTMQEGVDLINSFNNLNSLLAVLFGGTAMASQIMGQDTPDVSIS